MKLYETKTYKQNFDTERCLAGKQNIRETTQTLESSPSLQYHLSSSPREWQDFNISESGRSLNFKLSVVYTVQKRFPLHVPSLEFMDGKHFTVSSGKLCCCAVWASVGCSYAMHDLQSKYSKLFRGDAADNTYPLTCEQSGSDSCRRIFRLVFCSSCLRKGEQH